MKELLIMILIYLQDCIDCATYQEGAFTYHYADIESAIINGGLKRGFKRKLLDIIQSAEEAWMNQSPFMAAETFCNLCKLQKRNNLPRIISPLKEYRKNGKLDFLNQNDIIYSKNQLEYVKRLFNKKNKKCKKNHVNSKPLTYKLAEIANATDSHRKTTGLDLVAIKNNLLVKEKVSLGREYIYKYVLEIANNNPNCKTMLEEMKLYGYGIGFWYSRAGKISITIRHKDDMYDWLEDITESEYCLGYIDEDVVYLNKKIKQEIYKCVTSAFNNFKKSFK